MAFSFNPLWKLLIDKGITKVQLGKEIGVSSSTLAKMGKNEYVAMEVLDRICSLLECKIEDVVEHKRDAEA
jgi:DNA-binding Xre family transcriptional regulator